MKMAGDGKRRSATLLTLLFQTDLALAVFHDTNQVLVFERCAVMD